MKKLIGTVLLLALLLVFTACQSAQNQTETTRSETETTVSSTVTGSSTTEAQTSSAETSTEKVAVSPYSVVDALGRTVEFQSVPERVIAMGHGGLKFYAYMMGQEKLIGIEHVETTEQTLNGQSLHRAYPEIRNIPLIGKGGPKFDPEYEVLVKAQPDVIFASYRFTKEEVDAFQEKVKIPVVALDPGHNGMVFSPKTMENFTIIGNTLQEQDRAKAIIDFMNAAKADLESRAGTIEQSPEVYFGGASFRGPQGILSTKAKFELLNLLNIKNIMDQHTEELSIMIDKEKLLSMNPEMILIDLSGKTPLLEDMEADPAFYRALSAFENGKVYALLPYFTYGMNFDTAILDMYYIGKTVFPDQFKDVEIDQKAEEIYTFFVGKNVYSEMLERYPEAFQPFTLK